MRTVSACLLGKWRQYGSYCKPDEGYWAAKTGQVVAVLGLVRAV